MKQLLALCLLYAWLPIAVFSQSAKNKTDPSIQVATTFNYYPKLKPYSFMHEYYVQYNDLILNFITKTSGTFRIEEGDSVILLRTLKSHMPSQLLGIGASVQVRHAGGLFHELSLTKLTFNKSSHAIIYAFTDTLGFLIPRNLGYDENSFALAFRYELGTYFGRNKNARVRVGISGGIEPSYYRFKRRPFAITEYPLEARILTVDVALIPVLSAVISKKVSLDFKFVPNMLLADAGKMTEANPSFTQSQWGGTRNYKSPEMSFAFSLLLRYTVKEPKKKRGDG